VRLLIRLKLPAWVVIEDFGACDRCAQRLRRSPPARAYPGNPVAPPRPLRAGVPASHRPATADHLRRPLGGYERGSPGM